MTRPLSRARAGEVDAIVAAIVDDMMASRWVPGRSHREYAGRHGVSVSRVEDWATEAGRCIRVMVLTDKDQLRAQQQARGTARSAKLVKLGDVAEGSGEIAVAIKAVDSLRAEDEHEAKLLGLHAPAKVEVSVQAFDQMPPERQLDEIERRIEALQRHRERLLQAMSVPALPAGEDE